MNLGPNSKLRHEVNQGPIDYQDSINEKTEF